MHFELLESFSAPGDPAKPNEDSFAHTSRAVAVFDGATGLGERLMPGHSDAQWIAQFAARRFRAHAEAGDGELRDWLRATAADAEKSFRALRKRPPVENYEIAYASAVMATAAHGELQVLWFGDCAALLHTKDGAFALLGDTLSRKENERERVGRLVKPGMRGPAATGVRNEFLPVLRASRNYVNTAEEWLFAPDPACADHAKEARVAVAVDTIVLLASDGFLALASDYERYTPEQLLQEAQKRGLGALAEELRAIEAADPEGLKYPRFKRSDDATALLLRLRAL